jgi:uncharacterized protein (DUF1810 family)
MKDKYNLNRFIIAQESQYDKALSEIKNGSKKSHWIWFIFPQILGLGHSYLSTYYGIKNLEEAALYLEHPILGARLIEITTALLRYEGKSASAIMGSPDDFKLKSCMTLFSLVDKNEDSVFQKIIKKYFFNDKDVRTLQLIMKINNKPS